MFFLKKRFGLSNSGRSTTTKLFPYVWFFCVCLLSVPTLADVGVDFVSDGKLTADAETGNYLFFVEDCSKLVLFSYVSQGEEIKVSPSSAISNSVQAGGCYFPVEVGGDQRLFPSARFGFSDDTVIRHTEQFFIEKNPPYVELDSVRIAETGGTQYLVINVFADDDVDVSYVGIFAIGLRASDLETANGVIDVAKRLAFVDTNGYEQVRPTDEGQTQFELVLELQNSLSAEDIKSNGLILLDLVAVDASGNQTYTSTTSLYR